MEDIEWRVRLSNGAYRSQLITLFVDIASQYDLCVVEEEEDSAINLKTNKSYEFHTFWLG